MFRRGFFDRCLGLRDCLLPSVALLDRGGFFLAALAFALLLLSLSNASAASRAVLSSILRDGCFFIFAWHGLDETARPFSTSAKMRAPTCRDFPAA